MKYSPGTSEANGHMQMARTAAEPGLAALEAHYKASYGTLYGIALRMVRSPETAADVVQEAYADTAAKIRAGLEIENLGGWLYTVVKNQSLRRLKSPTVLPLEDDVEIVKSYTPAEIADLRARCDAIRRAIEELPEPQRPALIMAELRGMRYSEIAETLELSVDSVRLHLHRARERVRRAVGPETFAALLPFLRLGEAADGTLPLEPCPQGVAQSSLSRTVSGFTKIRQAVGSFPGRFAHALPGGAQMAVGGLVGGVLAAVVVTAGAGVVTSDRASRSPSGGPGRTVAQVLVRTPGSASSPTQALSSAVAPNPDAAITQGAWVQGVADAGGGTPTSAQDNGSARGGGSDTKVVGGCSTQSGGLTSAKKKSCAQEETGGGTPAETPSEPAVAAPSEAPDGAPRDEPPAEGTRSWAAPEDVSGDLNYAQVNPDVDVNAAGAAVMVWNQSDGANSIVYASTRAAGPSSSWTSPVPLSASGQNADSARVAIDGEGDAAAVWRRYNGSHNIIQGATLTAGGAWSSVSDLSAAGQNAGSPEVAVDADGDGAAIWRRDNGVNWRAQAATLSPAGAWGAASDLSEAGQNVWDPPQIDASANGDLVAVWSRFDGDQGTNVVQAATKEFGGAWSAAANVSGPDFGGAGHPQVGVAANGDAVVTWYNDGAPRIVSASTRPHGGAWTSPVQVSSTTDAGVNAQLAVNDAGDAVVVWSGGSSPYSIQAATLPAGGSWSTLSIVSTGTTSASFPDVGIGADGTVVAVWQYFFPSESINAATLSFGGSWSSPTTINTGSEESIYPHVGVDSDGDAVAAWTDDDSQLIQSAVYARH